jgi:hypothetical protein
MATFNFSEYIHNIERTVTSQFLEANSIAHMGDRGENRESILRKFLEDHLPARYGFAKGQVINSSGEISHSADIIIYDRLSCPLFYAGQTAILPVEGVYGIIEVKSTLSKTTFLDAAGKINDFKKMSVRNVGIVRKEQSTNLRFSSRPFGMIFAYQLADNSLESIAANLVEANNEKIIELFTNITCVLGVGNVFLRKIRWDLGEISPMMDTDSMAETKEILDYNLRTGKSVDNVMIDVHAEKSTESFGRFLSYLHVVLSRMLLNTPDIGAYLGEGMPALVSREG